MVRNCMILTHTESVVFGKRSGEFMKNFSKQKSLGTSLVRYRQIFLLSHLVATMFVGIILAAEGPAHAEQGKMTYQTFCTPCHGTQGKGDGPAGKMLTPPPANLTGNSTKGKSDKELLTIIQNGKPGTAMPPWKQSLSSQQIQDVLTYIRGLK